ncbi:hypothetical protein EDB87DRAFT_1684313 [Lactarius vividus]|nr:hypothetical protein EDB87DRAFT_1684313 [Lactarius vividus]
MSRAFGVGQRNDAAQHIYPPGSSWVGQDQAQLEEIDGSEALFAMYMERAGKEDREMAERWKADADSILVFTGLFSATVATAIGLTFPDLKPNPQDKSNFYLANIYQLLASSNGSQIIVPTTLPDPPAFSPPASAVWVNSLWFLSLVISLTCALFAIMLQQWARLYLTTAHPRYTLLKEARIRELFDEGVVKFRLPLIAEALRALHHTSFFLFLAGLTVLLFNTHVTVFAFVALWTGSLAVAYMCFTYVPVFWSNGPYYTPLSPLVWRITLTSLATPRFLAWLTYRGFELTSWSRLEEVYRRRRRQGMRRVAEESAQTRSQELDGRALIWTFKSLNEDQELERFISGIPSFCSSKAIEDPSSCLARLDDEGLSGAIVSLMHRALTSDLVSQSVKQRRIRVCTKAIDAAPVLASWRTLNRVFGEWDGLLGSVDFGRSVIRCIGNPDNDPRTDFCARCIVAVIIVRSQQSGGWSDLATVLLGISDDILFRYNLSGRNNVLLANLIFTTRKIVQFHSEHSWDTLFNVSSKTLDELSLNIDVQRTSPELRQEFCDLWNELVHTTRDSTDVQARSISTDILGRIRRNYIAFHENTDPTIPTAFYDSTNDHYPILYHAYPLCSVQSHHPIPMHPAPQNPE